MKKLILLLAIAVVTVSCEKTEYRPTNTDGDFLFVIKTKKGISRWGTCGNYSNKPVRIPCEYDLLQVGYNSGYCLNDIYIGVKEGKKYALDLNGELLLDGKDFDYFINKDQAKNSGQVSDSKKYLHEAVTKNGRYFFYRSESKWPYYGPYDFLFMGETGYAYKKDGKWGIQREVKIEKYEPLTANIYDAAIEVYGSEINNYWMVKKDGKWSAISAYTGKPIHKSQAIISRYLRLPIQDYIGVYIAGGRLNKDKPYQRVGNDECGLIHVAWAEDW